VHTRVDPAEPAFQAIISAMTFSLGVCCDEQEIHHLAFLPPTDEVAPQNALAAEAARQLCAYLADAEFLPSCPCAQQEHLFSAVSGNRSRPFRRTIRAATEKSPQALHNAPRAVGQACAANPYPVVVPCHRVRGGGRWIGRLCRSDRRFSCLTSSAGCWRMKAAEADPGDLAEIDRFCDTLMAGGRTRQGVARQLSQRPDATGELAGRAATGQPVQHRRSDH
jgi:methylated-DNA-[protein]-cysteine S-methyltransferase